MPAAVVDVVRCEVVRQNRRTGERAWDARSSRGAPVWVFRWQF